nr:hypothetical protein [Halobaculum saliterrae]
MLTIDDDGTTVVEWRLTTDGVERTCVDGYRPTMYVGAPVSELYGEHGGPTPRVQLPARGALTEGLRELRSFLEGQAAVESLSVDVWRQTFRADARPVLRVECREIDDVRSVARRVQQFGDADAYTCYNVDLTR